MTSLDETALKTASLAAVAGRASLQPTIIAVHSGVRLCSIRRACIRAPTAAASASAGCDCWCWRATCLCSSRLHASFVDTVGLVAPKFAMRPESGSSIDARLAGESIDPPPPPSPLLSVGLHGPAERGEAGEWKTDPEAKKRQDAVFSKPILVVKTRKKKVRFQSDVEGQSSEDHQTFDDRSSEQVFDDACLAIFTPQLPGSANDYINKVLRRWDLASIHVYSVMFADLKSNPDGTYTLMWGDYKSWSAECKVIKSKTSTAAAVANIMVNRGVNKVPWSTLLIYDGDRANKSICEEMAKLGIATMIGIPHMMSI